MACWHKYLYYVYETAEWLMLVMFQLKQTLTNKLSQIKFWKFIVWNKQQKSRDKFEVNLLSN